MALLCAPAALAVVFSLPSPWELVWFLSLPLAAVGGSVVGRWWVLWLAVSSALVATVITSLTYTPGEGEGDPDVVTWTGLALIVLALNLAAVSVGVGFARRR